MTWDTPQPPDPVAQPPDTRWRASCEAKSIFTSWAIAKRRAKKMTRREHDRGTGIRFEAYRGTDGHIHIGSQDRVEHRRKQSRRRRRRDQQEEDDDGSETTPGWSDRRWLYR